MRSYFGTVFFVTALLSACTVNQAYRVEPAGSPTRLELRDEVSAPLPAENSLLVRVREGGPIEAKLAAPLTCARTEVLETRYVRVEERTLQTGDKVAMWAGYAGAAAVAGLVGTGMANGSDVGTGVKIMAVIGLPFAALGATESYRALDRTESAPSKFETVDHGKAPCSEPAGGWNVTIRQDDKTATIAVGTQWKTVTEATSPGTLPAGYTAFEGVVEASWPLVAANNEWYAKADDSLERQIRQKGNDRDAPEVVQAAPPAPPAPAAPAVIKAEPIPERAVEPAPVAPLPVADVKPAPIAAPIQCPKTRKTEFGMLPVAFFKQPVRNYTVVANDWLSRISLTNAGDAMQYRVLYLLNRDRIKNPDRIYPGQQLRIPTETRSLDAWLEEIPSECRNQK